MKEAIISKSILAVGMVLAALLLSTGLKASQSTDHYQLAVGGSILYRLEKGTGRIDILIPAEEGAYLVPVWQMNPQMTGKTLSKEEQEKWGKISVATSQYLRMAQGTLAQVAEKDKASEPAK